MSQREVILTDKAPGAIGPYSQAIKAGGLVFCSGQIALDPETMEVVPGDIAQETHRVMKNLEAVLEAAGSSLGFVVKTTILLTDLGDFGAVNEVYGGYFPDAPPARACYQVSALPKGVRVEIEAIALG